MIVAYNQHKGRLMGERSTSMTLRAYNKTATGVKLTDVTGEAMDGYGDISVKELHSPVPGGIWLLVWGQMTGANGPNVRMRVYAYDGGKFRTIWMPANVWGNFAVTITDSGFTLDGPYYREGGERHDTYTAASDGLYLLPPGR